MKKGILYLSNEDVRALLDLGKAIETVERALQEHGEGRVGWSTPEDLAVKPAAGWQYWVTGCALESAPVAGFRFRAIKAAGGSRDPSRPPQGPRRILILSDREGGEVVAIMDEDWCHSVRTGAAATVACKNLARKGAGVFAMLGAGDTARATLPVMTRAFDLKEVRVLSRRPETREAYARELGAELNLEIKPVDTAEKALQGADMAVSATTTATPFINEEWIDAGAFIYSIGKHQELENKAYKGMGKLVVDSWEHCKKKSDMDRMLREGFLTRNDVHAELPDILAGKASGRENDEERIFMRAIGLVNQDIALAAWLYERAVEVGVGTRLPY
jgi:alanine dehydrogenase